MQEGLVTVTAKAGQHDLVARMYRDTVRQGTKEIYGTH